MEQKQVILITGASTGFGRLMAETLAMRQHTVFATMRQVEGRNAQNARAIRELAQREFLHLNTLEMDVTDENSVAWAVDAAIEQAGRIDCVINNAGYGLAGLTEAV